MRKTTPINIGMIDHVVIRVNNLETMVAFYHDVLGLRPERGPGNMGLMQLRARSIPDRPGGREWTPGPQGWRKTGPGRSEHGPPLSSGEPVEYGNHSEPSHRTRSSIWKGGIPLWRHGPGPIPLPDRPRGQYRGAERHPFVKPAHGAFHRNPPGITANGL